MAYSIYQTDAIVLGIQNIQEHDLMFRIFSPMFGYIRVIAKGARRNTSKLRANIQDYSVVNVSLVKGKEFFILTDIKCIFSFIQSRTIVNFLKQTESLFFSDENEHDTHTNEYIYNMFIRICKHIVWMISEKKDNNAISRVIDFFIIYVKGLQGFVEKIDVYDFIAMSDVELYINIREIDSKIENLKMKIQKDLS